MAEGQCPDCAREIAALTRGYSYGCQCGARLRFHAAVGWRREGVVLRATYVGRDPHLAGKTALIRLADAGAVEAQFDEVATGLGYGWHRFAAGDFEVDERHEIT